MSMKRIACALVCVGLWLGASSRSEATVSLGYINSSGGSLNYLAAYGINVTYISNTSNITASSLVSYNVIMIAFNAPSAIRPRSATPPPTSPTPAKAWS